MPMINAKKKFLEGGVYHVYNRGNNIGDIFFEEEDLDVFTWLLTSYLTLDIGGRRKNYTGRINLLAFCLMPTHFHFLLQQKDRTAMTEFMQSFLVSFTAYMNNKYGRVGHLFQGIYKGRFIKDDNDLTWTSRYIHRNGGDIIDEILNYPYSSIRVYLGERKNYNFVNSDLVLGLFGHSKNTYVEYLREGRDLQG